MPPAVLTGTVQDSKSKRQERLKSRFRDRGGIFVPSEGNALVDILLARGINGESPVKKRTPRKKAARAPPKSRPSAASRVARSKTPRTGSQKRAARKSAAIIPSDADENYAPPAKKRHDTSKSAKLSEGRRTPGPSRPRATAQRVPFANQLADAINSTKDVSDPCLTSWKVDRSDSDDSDVPLAKKHTKRARAVAGSQTMPAKGKQTAPLLPPAKYKERDSATEARDLDPDTVPPAVRRRKVAPDAIPPLLTTCAGVNSGGGTRVQVLQEKNVPTNAARKRKERIKTVLDASLKDDNEHEQPRKRRRRADPPSKSRGRKENKEMSRSAQEGANVGMDKPLPSPVKQATARSKPTSRATKPAKKPPSRAGTAQPPRSRGLPRAVLRRIKAIALALPARDDIDDDDPIDFLR